MKKIIDKPTLIFDAIRILTIIIALLITCSSAIEKAPAILDRNTHLILAVALFYFVMGIIRFLFLEKIKNYFNSKNPQMQSLQEIDLSPEDY